MRQLDTLWTYDAALGATDAGWVGFDVDATDGHIGTVDEMTTEAGRGSIVVDTGFWIFGKKRLLPAACVTSVDTEQRRVAISFTKAQVKEAPDYDRLRRGQPDYYEKLSDFYISRF